MTGGGVQGAASPEDPYGEGGAAEWRRVYDLVEALAADRARLQEISTTQRELWEAREKSLHARLLQAEASRTRWKTAYIELPFLANPKIAELQEDDLKDYTTSVDDDSSELKEARTGVELGQNKEDHDGIAGNLRTELRKPMQAYKTLSSRTDTEMSALLGAKNCLLSQLRTIEKENMALLKIKELEAAKATEAAQKLQRNIEELQVEARNKDDTVRGLQAEAADVKKRVLILDGRLLEMYSLVKEKNDEIQKLKLKADEKRQKTTHEMHCEQFMEKEDKSELELASIEQQRNDEDILKLVEDLKKEREEALARMLELEKKLLEKQNLEMEVARLSGTLEVLKHLERDYGGDSHDKIVKLSERIEHGRKRLEQMSRELVRKKRESDKKSQEAREKLIMGLEFY